MKKKEPKPITMDFFVTTDGFQRNYEMLMKEKSGRGNDALKRAFTETLISNATEHLMRQSTIAKNPRPKEEPTIKSLTIKSMRLWRIENHTLEEFISAATVGSIEGLELEEFEKENKRRFRLDWESIIPGAKKGAETEEENKERSLRTLEDWWKEAKEL